MGAKEDKLFFSAMKDIFQKKSPPCTGVEDEKGEVVYEKEEVKKIWYTFYKDRFKRKASVDRHAVTAHNNNNVGEIPEITWFEVHIAIKELRDGKAPGLDSIHGEILKAGGNRLVTILQKLFNVILKQKYVPQHLKDSLIVLIHKTLSKTKPKNYRAINLLSHIYKTFINILYRRMIKII